MEAKHILLIANGEGKADALYQSLFGPITPQVPASILQLHDDVSIVADEAALSRIIEKKSYLIFIAFVKEFLMIIKNGLVWEESGSFLTKICILIAIPIASQWMLLIRQMTPLLMHPVCM